MKTSSLVDERAHLANLLEAVQRCTYFLYASASKADWPLDGQSRKRRQKDEALFEALAAFNERFAKAASRLVALCAQTLGIMPATSDFESEFQRVCVPPSAPERSPRTKDTHVPRQENLPHHRRDRPGR
ncbi:MAG: hypothetical protein V4540_18000 [Pseudomonadota bacterium]